MRMSAPSLCRDLQPTVQVAYHAPGTIQEFLMTFPVRANQLLFWIGWLCCPALMVRPRPAIACGTDL